MILLDTSVLSRVFRRRRMGPGERQFRAAVEELMAGKAPLGLPGVVLQEVLSGIRSEKQFTDLRQRLLASFAVIVPTTDDYVDAARLRNRCLAKGAAVSGPDCLIASMTINGSHQLYAADDDFRRIARHAPLKLYETQGLA